MASAIKKFISTQTPKFHFLNRAVNGDSFKLLDVGAGNHSPSKIVGLFPKCEYYGVDLNLEYNYGDADKRVMKGFYEMDLTELQLDVIPDNFFDYINMAHIIEHLHNGDKVLKLLANKLKSGGHIYVEYPGKKSTKLPSMKGTLNFYDDKTHVRIYSVKELTQLFEQNGFTVLSSGMRRSWYYIGLMPFRLVYFLLKGGQLPGNIFWDLLGFAEYIYVRKN